MRSRRVAIPPYGQEHGYRIVAWIIVLGLHLGLVLVLSDEALRRAHPAALTVDAKQAMQLRLLMRALPASGLQATTRAGGAAAALLTARVRKAAASPVYHPRAPAPVRPRSPSAAIERETPVAGPPFSTQTRPGDDNYRAGGNLFQHALDMRHRMPLPGSGVAIVPGIRLIDPRTQGVAGVARKLQALFGLPDRHCVDVDTWRGLTTLELLARHLSPDRVEREALEYGCGPPRRDR